jgi:hypothetical protein
VRIVASDTVDRLTMVGSFIPGVDPEFETREVLYNPLVVPYPRGNAPRNGVRVVPDSNRNPVELRSVPFNENPSEEDEEEGEDEEW